MAKEQPGVWGIDLGQCALKAIRLEMIEGKLTATAFDYIEHPKILSQPDADPDQLTREALEQFLSRNDLRGDQVVISVPGQSGLARFVKLPPVEEKKIADIVRFEAKQQIPFPLEEVVWDFQKVSAGMVTDGFAMETEIGLFAIKRDMVNRYLQHFKDVNVEVHVVQMAPLALCNFLTYDLLGKDVKKEGTAAEDEGGKKSCVVALDIGTDSSNLVITDGDRIIWQRPIPLGGNHFTRALTKDLKLTFAKAEHVKRNAVKSPDLKKILAALKPVLNDFVGEVQRSLGYFTNTHRDASIQYMVGLGNAFRLPGLQKYLQEKLQLEVRKLQKLERLAGDDVINAPQFSENVLSFGVAYGLSLQGLELTKLQTNLLPQEIRFERVVRAKKPWAAAAAAALLLAAVFQTFGRSTEYKAVHNPDIEAAKKQAEPILSRINQINTDYSAQEQRVKEAIDNIIRVGSGVQERFNWQVLMQYINNALPRPNGAKVPERTRNNFLAKSKYVTKDALQAFYLLGQKRFAQARPKDVDPKELARQDEFIKKNLIQVNIEGVLSHYSDDLSAYFDEIAKIQGLPGMDPEEKVWVLTESKEERDRLLPKKGWVIEIRGYTYHQDRHDFVANTFVENLGHPKGVGNKTIEELLADVAKRVKAPEAKADAAPAAEGAEGAEKKEEPKDKMLGFFVVYKREVVESPKVGEFKIIQTSYLPSLLQPAGAGKGMLGGAGPMMMPPDAMMQGGNMAAPAAGEGDGAAAAAAAGPDRSAWTPIGEIASSILGRAGGAGGIFDKEGLGPGMPGMPVGPAMDPVKMMANPLAKVQPQPAGNNGEGADPTVSSQPRTEFVILFVWREPGLPTAAATTDPVAAAP